MNTFTHLVDDEVVLELVHHSHAEELFALIESCRPYLQRWLDWVPENTTVDDSRAWVEHTLARYAAGSLCGCVIRYRGELCGTYGLYMSERHRAGELGYWLAERFQGHGIVARCTPVMTRLGFEEFGMHRLMIRAADENLGSRRIPERFGWTDEGTLRSALEIDGRRLDMRFYSLLCDEAPLHEATQIGRFSRPIDDELTFELFHPGLSEGLYELLDRNRAYLGARLDFVHLVESVSDTPAFMKGALERYADRTAVRCALRWNGTLVGAIGLERINRNAGSGEIGYWVGESHAGQGIATRATRGMLDFAFDVEGLQRVEIRMATDNIASRRVAERVGAVHEGVARQSGRVRDETYDADVFSMLADEWRELRSAWQAEL